jgi:glycosyltransferase involved in cell wall biosynthesis
MRLVLFCPSFGEVAGIGHIAASLGREFRRTGHDVRVLARPAAGAPAAELPVQRLPYRQMPRRARHVASQLRFLRAFPPAVRALRRAVVEFEADAVLSLAISTYAAYTLALARVGPVVLSLQGGEPHGVFAAQPRVMRRALRRAAHVVPCARALGRAAVALAPEAAPRLTVIPNGVDPDRFAAGPVFTHARPYVLAVGRLTPQKGFDVLLDAFAALPHGSVDLLLAGDGPERAPLLARRARLGLEDRVHFLGAVEPAAIAPLYRGARLVVCPSRWEGLPLVCLEAMASARPVVASAVDGIPDAVLDGETGRLVPPDDAAALSAALHDLLADPRRGEHFGQRGQDRVRREFSWPDVARRYLGVLGRLVDRPGDDAAVPATAAAPAADA